MSSSRLRQLLPHLTACLGAVLLLPRVAEAAYTIPKLSISIPTVSFSSVATGAGQVSIAWLPEYLIGLYNYGLTIGGAVAAVMMMWGGFQWLVGSPDAGQKKIQNALVGLVILFGAYIILSTVDPATTNLKGLQFKSVGEENFQFSMKASRPAGGSDETTASAPSSSAKTTPAADKSTANTTTPNSTSGSTGGCVSDGTCVGSCICRFDDNVKSGATRTCSVRGRNAEEYCTAVCNGEDMNVGC